MDCSALRTLKIIDAVPILQFLQGPSCLLQGPSFWGRQRGQLIQPCSCSRCYSCRVFLFWTTTGTTFTTMQLFPLFSLSCIFWGRQQQQLIQPCSCSRCYSFCFRHSDCLFTFAQQDSTKEKRAVMLGFVTKNLKNFGPSQVKYYLCLQ